jgi:hypothetical protein
MLQGCEGGFQSALDSRLDGLIRLMRGKGGSGGGSTSYDGG